MACSKCDHKGYVETSVMRDNGARPITTQCWHCRDVAAYSRRIQQILSEDFTPPPPEPFTPPPQNPPPPRHLSLVK